jgi:hypothetical protein
VPAEIVGSWYAGGVSPTEFYNPNTGSWSGSSYGSGLFFTLNADGTFVRGFQMFSQLYGCGTLTFTYTKGTIVMDEAAGAFELHPQSATIYEQNSCSGWSDSHAIQGEQERIYFRRGTDDYGATTLWLREDDTTWTAFHPKEWFE